MDALNALHDALFIIDPDTGIILESNLAAVNLFGHPQEALAGMAFAGLSAASEGFDQGRIMEKLRQTLEKGRQSFPWKSLRAQGGTFWSDVRTTLAQRDGRTCAMAVVRDISEQRHWERTVSRVSAEWQATFDAVGDALALLDEDCRILRGNRALAALTGREVQELPGMNCWTALGLDPREAGASLLAEARRSRSRQMGEWKVGEGTLEVSLDPVFGAEGGLERIILTVRDITQRKVHETTERRFRSLVENASVGIVECSPEGGFLLANPRFQAMAGFGAEDLALRTILDITHPGDRAEAASMVRALMEGQRPYSAWESRFLRPDGEQIWVQLHVSLVLDAAGAPDRLVAVVKDITQIKRNEDERLVLEERIQQAQRLESLGSLAGGIAHDLNNVLGAILGLASSDRAMIPPSAPLARSLDTIIKACTRGRGVIQGLLCFARKELAEVERIDANQLLREMVGLLSRTTLQRIRFELDLEASLLPIEGDPGALSHAFMNLCVNAMDAMPLGGRLRLGTRNLPDRQIEVQVEDTGEGMDEDILKKAMDPFFTTKPMGKGTGLGLSMVFGTVQAHRGTIRIASRPGEGTCIHLTFPAAADRPAPGPEASQARSAAQAASLRVLLVDDDELIRESFTPILALLGHDVEAVAGGQEALDRIREGLRPDLVILDMNMPGMTGPETLPRLLELLPDLKVLMASGYSEQEARSIMPDNPHIHAISKPFSMNELRKKLEQVVGQGPS